MFSFLIARQIYHNVYKTYLLTFFISTPGRDYFCVGSFSIIFHFSFWMYTPTIWNANLTLVQVR